MLPVRRPDLTPDHLTGGRVHVVESQLPAVNVHTTYNCHRTSSSSATNCRTHTDASELRRSPTSTSCQEGPHRPASANLRTATGSDACHLWALPEALLPKPTDTVWVRAVDADGRLVHDLQTGTPGFSMVMGVREHAGTVWMGSLQSTTIASITLRSAD